MLIKNKHLIVVGILITLFSMWFVVGGVQALPCSEGDLCYKPNVPIPIQSLDGRYNFDDKEIKVDPDLLANYIVAIYRYGAGFAGIVAMFMLVIAGWRWLMAGGNAQKISASKEMVNGVLIGLALLFGGQLLLRQIADDFDSIKTLDIGEPNFGSSINEADRLYCSGFDEELGVVDANKTINTCGDYGSEALCYVDKCTVNMLEAYDTGIVKSFAGVCVPKFDSNLIFDSCEVCPPTCNCDIFYTDVFYKKVDPCDCDRDKNIVDDECKNLPYLIYD